jgi:hypothetical protein
VSECDLENLVNENALAHWGLLRQIKKKMRSDIKLFALFLNFKNV